MMKVFCIEILVGLVRPDSFFCEDDPWSSPSFYPFPVLLALAVKFNPPLPVLLGDPKVPPNLVGDPA